MLKRMNTAKNTDQRPPQFIHYIWVGDKPMREADLIEMKLVAGIAHRSNFTVILWTDNEINFHKSCFKAGINIPGLQLRNPFVFIKEELSKELFFQQDNRTKKFELYVVLELIGSKNTAACSDLLRYAIIWYFGGYYFDTDVRFLPKMRDYTYFKDERPKIDEPSEEMQEDKSLIRPAEREADIYFFNKSDSTLNLKEAL